MKLCLRSALNHGFTKNEIFIVSLDYESYRYFSRNDIQTIFMNYTSLLANDWIIIGHLKQAIQYYLNCLNVDVLFFESDMIFCSDFKNEMIATLNDGVDIQIMEESHNPHFSVDISQRYFSFNLGIMLVRSSENTQKLFRRWLHDCYDTSSLLWDQNMFTFMITNNALPYKTNKEKQYVHFKFNLDNQIFNLTFHFLNPVKYINYCSLIQKQANAFNPNKVDAILGFARTLKLVNPYLVHFACINGPNKFTYMRNISLSYNSYQYHMNYLLKFPFVL